MEWQNYFSHDDRFYHLIRVILGYMNHPSRTIAMQALDCVGQLNFPPEDIESFIHENFASIFYGKFTFPIVEGVMNALFNGYIHKEYGSHYLNVLRPLLCIIRSICAQKSGTIIDVESQQPITILSISNCIRQCLKSHRNVPEDMIVDLVNMLSGNSIAYLKLGITSSEKMNAA